jgi:hypothetical protein
MVVLRDLGFAVDLKTDTDADDLDLGSPPSEWADEDEQVAEIWWRRPAGSAMMVAGDNNDDDDDSALVAESDLATAASGSTWKKTTINSEY